MLFKEGSLHAALPQRLFNQSEFQFVLSESDDWS